MLSDKQSVFVGGGGPISQSIKARNLSVADNSDNSLDRE